MKKYLVPIISSLVLIVLFVVGLLFNNGIKYQNQLRLIKEVFPEAESFELISDPGYEFQQLDDENRVYEAYKVLKAKKEIGYVYYVTAKGRNADLKVAVGFNSSPKKITGLKVLEHNETPSYFAKIQPSFFNQFVGKAFDVNLFKVNKANGATDSSHGFERAITVARLQYAHDAKWEIPAPVEVVSSKQDLDTLNLIYEFKFADETYLVTLDQEYSFVSSDKEIEDDAVVELFESFAASNPMTDIIKSVETTGSQTIIVITAKGFASTLIKGTIVYDADQGKFTSFTISEHQESDGYGEDLIDGSYRDEVKDNSDIDIVTEVTITSNALKTMVKLAEKYVDEVINNE